MNPEHPQQKGSTMKTRKCGLCNGSGRNPVATKFTCVACSGRGWERVPADGTPGPRRLSKLVPR